MARTWIAFISRTGAELKEISKRLGRPPNYIFTNNLSLDPKMFKGSIVVQDTTSNLFKRLNELQLHNPFITLHGFMRIIPPDICRNFEIYNGHPGDILTYPELKGKDPQKKAIELSLPNTCCVIHKVTEGVDEGKILVYSTSRAIHRGMTEDELSNELRNDSIELWVRFLQWSMKL